MYIHKYISNTLHKSSTYKNVCKKKSLLSTEDSKSHPGKEPRVKTVFKGAVHFISMGWTFYNKKIFIYIYVIFEMKNIFKHMLAKKKIHTQKYLK